MGILATIDDYLAPDFLFGKGARASAPLFKLSPQFANPFQYPVPAASRETAPASTSSTGFLVPFVIVGLLVFLATRRKGA